MIVSFNTNFNILSFMNSKKLSLKALSLLMFVTLAAGLLSSCGKDSSGDKLVESIPSSAMFVVKLNPQQVIENAGCSVDNGKIVLSDKISDAIKGEAGAAALKIINEYLAYTEGINLDAIMIFATNSQDVAGVATLSDAEPVKKHLKELVGSEKEEDGFTVYKLGYNGVIAIKGDMLWIADKLSVINRHIENAGKSNISSVSGVAELLGADNAMAYVLALPRINSELEKEGVDFERELKRNMPASMASKIADIMDYYVCGSFTFDGNTASGEAFLVNEQGNRFQFGKIFNPINTDFLKNVPAGANFIAACGDIAEPDLKSLIEQAAKELSGEVSDPVMSRNLYDMLAKWDGTAAFAFDLNAFMQTDWMSLMNMSESRMMNTVMSNMKFVFMAHYPQDVVKNFADALYESASASESVTTVRPGFYSAPVTPEVSLFFGNLNGYFAFANTADASGATSLADKFSGKHLEIYSHSDAIPAMARFGWTFGSEGELWIENDAIKMYNKLTGTNLKYLQAMIEPLTDMKNLENLIDYLNSVYASSYNSHYYDFDDDDYNFDDLSDVTALDSVYIADDYYYGYDD